MESPSNPVLLYRLAYSLWPQFNFPLHTSCRPFHEIWTLVAFLTVPQNNWFLINCLGWHWEQFTLFTNVWNLSIISDKVFLGEPWEDWNQPFSRGVLLCLLSSSACCFLLWFSAVPCCLMNSATDIWASVGLSQINKHRCVCYPICLFFLFTESNVDKLHFI